MMIAILKQVTSFACRKSLYFSVCSLRKRCLGVDKTRGGLGTEKEVKMLISNDDRQVINKNMRQIIIHGKIEVLYLSFSDEAITKIPKRVPSLCRKLISNDDCCDELFLY
jgi:hypothetical protein